MRLSKLCTTYLSWIERTCSLEFHGLETLPESFVVGFWHQDSLLMSLVLGIMARQGLPVTVVMTADKRGDTIDEVVRSAGGRSFRLSYEGRAALGAVKGLIRHAEREQANLATPLDGPLGPLHLPKKFNFLLAQKTGRSFVGVRVDYSSRLSLVNRWDNYMIPLPFSRISIYAHNFGRVERAHLHNFAAYRRTIQGRLLPEERFMRLERLECLESGSGREPA